MFPQHDQLIFKSQLWSSVFHHTFILLLLTDIATGQSQTGTTSQTIIAFVGEDVILPCHLEPASDAVSMSVEWRRLDLDPRYVHVWNEGQTHLIDQNPSYKGRTSLSTEKLKQGDLSLTLSRVKHSDSGTYTCYFPSESKESIVELLVGTGCPPCIYTYDVINLAFSVFCGVLLCVGAIFIFCLYKKSKINEELNTLADRTALIPEQKDHLQHKEELNMLTELNAVMLELKKDRLQHKEEMHKLADTLADRIALMPELKDHLQQKEELNMLTEFIAVMLELKKDHLQHKEEFKLLEETNKKLTENKEELHLVENDIAKSEKERQTDKKERYLEQKKSLLSAQHKLEKTKGELENLQLDTKNRQLQQIDDIMSKLRERKSKFSRRST